MCTKSRYIYNPYSRKAVLVKCGHCEACLQEKANARANRIRHNVSPGTITLFVTLTYSNDYVPFVRRSDLKSDSFELNVLRNCTGRYVYDSKNGLRFKKTRELSIVDTVYVPNEIRTNLNVCPLKSLQGAPSDCIGVCLNSDFQKFIKRLKQILLRNYNYGKKFSYMYCSEYGSFTHRPHFHALVFIRANDEALFRNAIVQAWPYAHHHLTKDNISIARDASTYVAAYVNSNMHLNEILKDNNFKPSSAFSIGFGVGLDCFSLDSILQKIREGNLAYYAEKEFDGKSCVVALPIPSYVINRYFPKFKGFSLCTSDALQGLLLRPFSNCWTLKDLANIADSPLYNFSDSECYEIGIRLNNAYLRFAEKTGMNRYDYALYYTAAWRVRAATNERLLHSQYEGINDYTDFYENVKDVNIGVLHTDIDTSQFTENYNERKDILEKDSRLTDLYYKLDKSRKVNNIIMAELNKLV